MLDCSWEIFKGNESLGNINKLGVHFFLDSRTLLLFHFLLDTDDTLFIVDVSKSLEDAAHIIVDLWVDC